MVARLQSVLRQLLPGACLLCEGPLSPRAEPDLCEFCLQTLPWNDRACPRCAEPLEDGDVFPSSPPSEPSLPCNRCRLRPPPFELALAPLRYEGHPRRWVGRLKDHLGMVEGRILGAVLADAAESLYAHPMVRPPDVLVPVPLTARRLARRGHNQALTLARPLAARLRLPLLRRAVIRQHAGRAQRGLARHERLENPVAAFAIRRWHGRGDCIAIVDDVMTTGATAASLARVLLAAGAAEVHVLCATRTPRERPPAGMISACLTDAHA